MFRIISNIFLILSIFLFPQYITVIFLLISLYIFNNFFESIIYAFILDLLYSNGNTFGIHFGYQITLIIFVLYLLSFKLKAILRTS